MMTSQYSWAVLISSRICKFLQFWQSCELYRYLTFAIFPETNWEVVLAFYCREIRDKIFLKYTHKLLYTKKNPFKIFLETYVFKDIIKEKYINIYLARKNILSKVLLMVVICTNEYNYKGKILILMDTNGKFKDVFRWNSLELNKCREFCGWNSML